MGFALGTVSHKSSNIQISPGVGVVWPPTPTQMCRCPRNFPACPFLSHMRTSGPKEQRRLGHSKGNPHRTLPNGQRRGSTQQDGWSPSLTLGRDPADHRPGCPTSLGPLLPGTLGSCTDFLRTVVWGQETMCMSMPSERGLLGSMMEINKEDKMRINVMGQVLSCPQFIFRTTPPTDGETEAREVRPPSSNGWNPSTEGSRTEQVPEDTGDSSF